MISLEQTVSDLSGRQFGLALLRTSASSVSSTVRCGSPEELSMPNNLPLTLTGAAAALRAGTVTSVQLTEASITRAAELDGQLGVYLARFNEYAMAAAAQADAELGGGVGGGPLHGIPCAVKDILAMAEGPTTAQSLILDPAWGAGRAAPVVSRLKKAGAVITGKTTTMEIAIGMPDTNKAFPLPRNPWDTATWPGGSSSGSGAGVAASLFYMGIGTDTVGSIRIPAGFCGVSGLMPTFGRVPKSGCVALGYSWTTLGPLSGAQPTAPSCCRSSPGITRATRTAWTPRLLQSPPVRTWPGSASGWSRRTTSPTRPTPRSVPRSRLRWACSPSEARTSARYGCRTTRRCARRISRLSQPRPSPTTAGT